MNYKKWTSALLSLCLIPLSANSNAKVDISNQLDVEHRIFWQTPLNEGQLEHHQSSIAFSPELEWSSHNDRFYLKFKGFYRWDDRDTVRTHTDIREFFIQYQAEQWDILVGINKVFWGVTESRHLVDIINQNDLLEDVDFEDKLGQPMVNLKWYHSWGDISLFWLPIFRELDYPGPSGRYSVPIESHHGALYETTKEDHHQDWALRYSRVLGNVDLGLSFFNGTSREPRLISITSATLIPIYDQIRQWGLDAQYTGENILIKLEAIARDSRADTFAASVIGIEYTFYQFFNTASDLGLIIEYLWDERNQVTPATPFNNDTFIGSRWTLNDTEDSQFLGGIIIDNDHQQILMSVEFERRLSETWSLELTARAIVQAEQTDALFFSARDDHLRLNLTKYF